MRYDNLSSDMSNQEPNACPLRLCQEDVLSQLPKESEPCHYADIYREVRYIHMTRCVSARRGVEGVHEIHYSSVTVLLGVTAQSGW